MFGVGMLELMQCFIDVAWHGDVNSPVGVTPHKGEAAKKRPSPVNGDCVQAAEFSNEVVRGGVAGVFDTKIVNEQREHNVQVYMCPE